MAHRRKHRDAAARARKLGAAAATAVIDEPAPDSRTATEPPEVSAYAEAILLGLQLKPYVHQGPVPDHRFRGRRLSDEIIARRRIRGRIAKQSRKANRRQP